MVTKKMETLFCQDKKNLGTRKPESKITQRQIVICLKGFAMYTLLSISALLFFNGNALIYVARMVVGLQCLFETEH